MISTDKRYVYVSSAKIRHEFDKIPPSLLSRLGFELEGGIEVVKAKVTIDRRPPTVFSKLDAVLKHLRQRKRIGSVSTSLPYFSGEAELQWGEFFSSGVVYFTGKLDDTVFGMTGSLKHVQQYSEVPALLQYSGSGAGAVPAIAQALPPEIVIVEAGRKLRAPPESQSEAVLKAVSNVYGRLAGPSFSRAKLEFVAERLCEEQREQSLKVVLGTPIYVARVEALD